jgi:hypothetical protein
VPEFQTTLPLTNRPFGEPNVSKKGPSVPVALQMMLQPRSTHPIRNSDALAVSIYFFFNPNSINRSFKNSPADISVYNFGYSVETQEGKQVKSISERGCMKKGME